MIYFIYLFIYLLKKKICNFKLFHNINSWIRNVFIQNICNEGIFSQSIFNESPFKSPFDNDFINIFSLKSVLKILKKMFDKF